MNLNAPQDEAKKAEAVPSATEQNADTTFESTGLSGMDADPEGEAETLVADAELGEESAEAPAEPKIRTRASLIADAEALAQLPAADINREDINRLRAAYAQIVKAEDEAARAAFVAEGGDPADFVAPGESDEDTRFKEVIDKIRQLKAEHLAALEAERAANLARKKEIVEQINRLAEDTDNVNRTFQEYRDLQDAFNAIGAVPAPDETTIWKQFQEAREHYSDNLKINKELRDYDFQKNLEQKEALIARAAALDAETDIVAAFRQLQDMQNDWRRIGPVAKDFRDDVWARFKEASQNVAKRYQTFFEERKARETANEQGKTAICERVEAMDFSALTTFPQWEEATAKIKEAQDDWKKLGFASRKMNNALFNRFRATCDTFFALKADFYRSVKDSMAKNLELKTALADKAEALKDSTDWKKTTDAIVALQKEWKTIGAVQKKYSDAVWRRFQQACDHFFEQKKAATSDSRRTEQANLQAKRDLIKELDNITAETSKADARNLINDLQERWKMIGHVPFKEKDKVYEQFRARINQVREQFDIAARRNDMSRFEASVSDMGNDASRLQRERERQARLLETRRAELRTYENNLGFLTAKSKSGNTLVSDFERKIDRLKAEIVALEDKIKLIDSKN